MQGEIISTMAAAFSLHGGRWARWNRLGLACMSADAAAFYQGLDWRNPRTFGCS